MQKPKIIVILGQTATGKSGFAVEVAKKINGEIISADSRQVYKGMDLGTGKVTKKEMGGIPHFMLDVISPKNKTFSAGQFQKMAKQKIKEILDKKNIPIICGGTGYYIDSLINSLPFPEVLPNKKLRKELEGESATELFEILKKIDKNRAKNIDAKNKVRLIRAIEIAQELGEVPKLKKTKKEFETIKIGLAFPDNELKRRIYKRLIKRIKKGMIKEVEKLHESGVSWKKLESFGLEYRYVSFYLQKKMTKEEMIEKLFSAIWHFAKRQKTWWKKDKEIIWINPS
ncbi:MAG TPA: tRNA (adenosine(37)-N6)-dimethylallyltransferase MiaA, partial [Candidatus Paceibacterota bacterium]|nr:tRNA (adenosine(37)-N6)-dimethylallyltransferase MiaA [Candidatus Paceibacterota bacterium]HQM18766.1 tRNA (adenosine(37)-N6)-dimethylallyltransferase MiaA [Candidatus Paceibacterota bacterium]